jgi:hypothetical protein
MDEPDWVDREAFPFPSVAALNGHAKGIKTVSGEYRPGDKLIQLRNNYDKNLFNGDIGTVVSGYTTLREHHRPWPLWAIITAVMTGHCYATSAKIAGSRAGIRATSACRRGKTRASETNTAGSMDVEMIRRTGRSAPSVSPRAGK